VEGFAGENGCNLDPAQAKGMTIAPPSEQADRDLRKVGNYMLAEWLRKAGDDGAR